MKRDTNLLALLLIACFPWLVSCGSGSHRDFSAGNGSLGDAGRGSVRFTIHWTTAAGLTRVIPVDAQSIRIDLTSGITHLDGVTVVRPPAGQTTSNVGFVGLAPGNVLVTATAYSDATGGGTALATGSVSVQIKADTITPATLTMNLLPNNLIACQANPHKSGQARWTVLVYMNAANSLQPFSLLNIAQMASIGTDSNVNIVVQWKQTQAGNVQDCSDCAPSFVGTRRYLIRNHSPSEVNSLCTNLSDAASCSRDESVLDTDRLADPATNVTNPSTGISTSDMGDWRTLSDFVHWGVKNYPADHIALVLWNHGSGWRPILRTAHMRSITRAVSLDEETNREIETWEIPQALTNLTQPLDIIIMDCSLELQTEVAYELKNSARVLVGSEDSPPGAGYPYHKWLAALKASGQTPCDLGASIVSTFVANYSTSSNVTQSVIDLTKMQDVANAVDSFGGALDAHRSDQQSVIASARNNAQHYEPENAYIGYEDLYSFADRIAAITTKTDLKQAAVNVKSVLTTLPGGAILTNGHGSFGEAESYGLSIYNPDPVTFTTGTTNTLGTLKQAYQNLAFAQAAPRWLQFLANER